MRSTNRKSGRDCFEGPASAGHLHQRYSPRHYPVLRSRRGGEDPQHRRARQRSRAMSRLTGCSMKCFGSSAPATATSPPCSMRITARPSTMIGMSDDLSQQSPPADRILLDRRVFDRVGGAVQPVDRAASQPAQPSRRRGAVHHESPSDGRGARVVDRLPHRRHHCRSPDPNRPVRTPRQADPRRARQAIREAPVPAEARRHWRARGGDGSRARPAGRLFHLGPARTCRHRVAGSGVRQASSSRRRCKTSAGLPTRTTNWSFRGKPRRRRW